MKITKILTIFTLLIGVNSISQAMDKKPFSDSSYNSPKFNETKFEELYNKINARDIDSDNHYGDELSDTNNLEATNVNDNDNKSIEQDRLVTYNNNDTKYIVYEHRNLFGDRNRNCSLDDILNDGNEIRVFSQKNIYTDGRIQETSNERHQDWEETMTQLDNVQNCSEQALRNDANNEFSYYDDLQNISFGNNNVDNDNNYMLQGDFNTNKHEHVQSDTLLESGSGGNEIRLRDGNMDYPLTDREQKHQQVLAKEKDTSRTTKSTKNRQVITVNHLSSNINNIQSGHIKFPTGYLEQKKYYPKTVQKNKILNKQPKIYCLSRLKKLEDENKYLKKLLQKREIQLIELNNAKAVKELIEKTKSQVLRNRKTIKNNSNYINNNSERINTVYSSAIKDSNRPLLRLNTKREIYPKSQNIDNSPTNLNNILIKKQPSKLITKKNNAQKVTNKQSKQLIKIKTVKKLLQTSINNLTPRANYAPNPNNKKSKRVGKNTSSAYIKNNSNSKTTNNKKSQILINNTSKLAISNSNANRSSVLDNSINNGKDKKKSQQIPVPNSKNKELSKTMYNNYRIKDSTEKKSRAKKKYPIKLDLSQHDKKNSIKNSRNYCAPLPYSYSSLNKLDYSHTIESAIQKSNDNIKKNK